jgi:hypothetical protein
MDASFHFPHRPLQAETVNIPLIIKGLAAAPANCYQPDRFVAGRHFDRREENGTGGNLFLFPAGIILRRRWNQRKTAFFISCWHSA